MVAVRTRRPTMTPPRRMNAPATEKPVIAATLLGPLDAFARSGGGATVGSELGDNEGAGEGITLGMLLGISEGESLGEIDGEVDGMELG